MPRRLLTIAVSIAITVGSIWLLVLAVPVAQVWPLLRSVDPLLLALACIGPILLQVARTVRLRAALLSEARTVSSARLYHMTVIHQFFANLMPARLGEAALPIMLKRAGITGLLEGGGLLLGLRLLDLAAFVGLAAAAAAVTIAAIALPAAALAVGALGALVLLSAVAMWVQRQWAGHMGTDGWRGAIGAALRGLGAHDPTARVQIIACTLAIPLLMAGYGWLVVLAMGWDVSPVFVLLLVCGGGLAWSLPVNGIAQVGPVQGAWVLMAEAAGADPVAALGASILVHAIAIAMAAAQAAAVTLWSPTRQAPIRR